MTNGLSRRRVLTMLTGGALGGLAMTLNPGGILTPTRTVAVTLPFLSGPQVVRFSEGEPLFAEAHAQYNPYAQNYMMRMQQARMMQARFMMQRQAAMRYRALMTRQAQQHRWLNSQRQSTMTGLVNNYRQGWQVSEPQVWSNIKSVYGYAQKAASNPSQLGELALFGLNKLGEKVGIKDTITGAVGIWNELSQLVSNQGQKAKLAEYAAGPQSDERPMKISLPNGPRLPGQGYRTLAGRVKVSNRRVESNGRTGRLIQYDLPGTGRRFTIA